MGLKGGTTASRFGFLITERTVATKKKRFRKPDPDRPISRVTSGSVGPTDDPTRQLDLRDLLDVQDEPGSEANPIELKAKDRKPGPGESDGLLFDETAGAVPEDEPSGADIDLDLDPSAAEQEAAGGAKEPARDPTIALDIGEIEFEPSGIFAAEHPEDEIEGAEMEGVQPAPAKLPAPGELVRAFEGPEKKGIVGITRHCTLESLGYDEDSHTLSLWIDHRHSGTHERVELDLRGRGDTWDKRLMTDDGLKIFLRGTEDRVEIGYGSSVDKELPEFTDKALGRPVYGESKLFWEYNDNETNGEITIEDGYRLRVISTSFDRKANGGLIDVTVGFELYLGDDSAYNHVSEKVPYSRKFLLGGIDAKKSFVVNYIRVDVELETDGIAIRAYEQDMMRESKREGRHVPEPEKKPEQVEEPAPEEPKALSFSRFEDLDRMAQTTNYARIVEHMDLLILGVTYERDVRIRRSATSALANAAERAVDITPAVDALAKARKDPDKTVEKNARRALHFAKDMAIPVPLEAEASVIANVGDVMALHKKLHKEKEEKD